MHLSSGAMCGRLPPAVKSSTGLGIQQFEVQNVAVGLLYGYLK